MYYCLSPEPVRDSCFISITFQSYFIRSDYLTIATTRPETLFGDVAIAVNPQVRWQETICTQPHFFVRLLNLY